MATTYWSIVNGGWYFFYPFHTNRGPTNRLNDVPSKADATIEASPVNMTLFYFRQLADKQNSARLVHICSNLLTTTFAIKNLCI
jgi:hypothetical protein